MTSAKTVRPVRAACGAGMAPFQGYDTTLAVKTQGFTLGCGMTPVPG